MATVAVADGGGVRRLRPRVAIVFSAARRRLASSSPGSLPLSHGANRRAHLLHRRSGGRQLAWQHREDPAERVNGQASKRTRLRDLMTLL